MKKILGIEFGSTRIKSVLIDEGANVLSTGGYEWENILADGLWSYPMELVEKGLRESYASLAAEYREKFGEELTSVDGIGISAMMHGYLAFDKDDVLLAPFRTWRNTNTAEAAGELTELFNFHIPLRWSVAQYYQSVLDGLPHVHNVAHLYTLSSFVHYKLTGRRVIGIGDASGMFPVKGRNYDHGMIAKINELLAKKGTFVNFEELLPEVLLAGEDAGVLTEEGALYIDPTGKLQAGAPVCPPEGDMGTGMIATNSLGPKTANISSGTSANMVVILEKALSHYYSEIDVIATPDGCPAALIHTNNCTSEINEWVDLFEEVLSLGGVEMSKGELYTKLFNKSLESDGDVGKMVGYNFLAGEPLGKTEKGFPLVAREHDGKLTLSNFMQMQIYSAIATLALGMDILKRENVKIDSVMAHGGFYKTDFVGQNATSAVVKAPVTVMENAGEGGAWGMAILALYALSPKLPLPEFLAKVFENTQKTTVLASDEEMKKFDNFIKLYVKYLALEKLAAED